MTRIMPRANPQTLADPDIDRLLREAPSAFVSRLPILCEGETESGFLGEIFEHYALQEDNPRAHYTR